MRSEADIRLPLPACFAGLAVLLASCGPAPPARGTPAWYWQAAQETWEAGDLQKASDHLEALTKPGGEYVTRAAPWRMVLTGGVAQGLMDMADAFENGSRANQAAATDFRREMNRFRAQANRQALQFAETFLIFEKVETEDTIPIAFTYPKGSLLPVAELAKAGEGMALSASEVETARVRALQRGILMLACSVVGAQDDTAKAQQVFQAEKPTVPKTTFVLAIAKKLRDLSELYSPSKGAQPERVQFFKQKALDALKTLPENDETKKLMEEIEKDLNVAEKGA